MGNKTSKIEREAVAKFQSTELDSLRDKFADISAEHSHVHMVDKAAFKKAFNLSEGISDQLFKIFKEIDGDNSDQINFGEFAAGIAMLCKGTIDEKIKFLFNLYAINKEYIDKNKLTLMLKSTHTSSTKIRKSFAVPMQKVDVESIDSPNPFLDKAQEYAQTQMSFEDMANAAFSQYCKEKNDRMKFEEFKEWASKNKEVYNFFEKLFGIGQMIPVEKTEKEAEFEKEIKSCTLKDFEILHNIGRGRYVKVNLVKHKKSGEFFALKTMSKSIILEDNQADAVLIEKSIHASLIHRFVCKLWSTFHDDRNLYMLLELAKGGSLLHAVKVCDKFDKESSRYYTAQIILGLEYIHNKGIIFRDLKLDNVLLSEDGLHIKLTDFGFAKFLRNDETAHSFLGSPEYLAPEIIVGKGYNNAVDWWALGIMVYKMMCGKSPLTADSPKQLYDKILAFKTKDLVFPEFFDESTCSIIKMLLHTTPSKRLGKTKYDIKLHPWFDGVDWLKLEHGTKLHFRTCVDIEPNTFLLGQEGAPPVEDNDVAVPVPESYKKLFTDF